MRIHPRERREAGPDSKGNRKRQMTTSRELLGLQRGQNLNKHRTYRIWRSMMQRCYRVNHHARKRYGGKGVAVCARWHRFDLFLTDMGHPPSSKHSIDRYPNKAGNYEPNNCRWATPAQQARNKLSCIYIETPAGRVTMKEASEYYGVKYQTAWRRAERGWPAHLLFIQPTTKPRRLKP